MDSKNCNQIKNPNRIWYAVGEGMPSRVLFGSGAVEALIDIPFFTGNKY